MTWLTIATFTMLFGGVFYLLVTVAPFELDVTSSMTWIEANPTMGAVLLPLVLALSIPLCLPSLGFEILAGSVSGVVAGTLLCVVGKTLGQLVAFLVAKHFGSDRVSGYIQNSFPAFAAFITVLQTSGWKPLLLIQVANVPHLVKCYGLAIADISTFRFAVSSGLGGLPYAILWAYIGHHCKKLVAGTDDENGEQSEMSLRQRMMVGVAGIVVTILTMWWLVVYTKKQLHHEMRRVKHLHRANNDRNDVCITISSLENDNEMEQVVAP